MKDLSREEKLVQLIDRLEGSLDDKKWMRTRKTFFVLCPVVYFIVFVCDGMNCAQDYFRWLIAAPIFAGLIMFTSILVTLYMFSGSMSDEKYLARLRGELDAIRICKKETKDIERELNEYKELKNRLKRLEDLLGLLIDEYRDLEFNEDEESESIKHQLENLKFWLKQLEIECKLLKFEEDFDDEI